MMLSGIAHEVRNPLGGIELFLGLLDEDSARGGAFGRRRTAPAREDHEPRAGVPGACGQRVPGVRAPLADRDCALCGARDFVGEIEMLMAGDSDGERGLAGGLASSPMMSSSPWTRTGSNGCSSTWSATLGRPLRPAPCSDSWSTSQTTDHPTDPRDRSGRRHPRRRSSRTSSGHSSPRARKARGWACRSPERWWKRTAARSRSSPRSASGTTVTMCVPFDDSVETKKTVMDIPEGWLG